MFGGCLGRHRRSPPTPPSGADRFDPPGPVPPGGSLFSQNLPAFTSQWIVPTMPAVGERVPGDMVLQTEDLTKDFAGFVAVRAVNLRVARGTIHAMIGPNGAGKTTCFNLLSKFLSPTRGRIVFDGRDITALKPADVAQLGLGRSFQISAVFPHLTVL